MKAVSNQFGVDERSFALVLQSLEAHTEIEQALVFGSRAMGTARPGSDIDLAITGDSVTPELASALARELNERAPIPYYVDVVSLPGLTHEELRRHIETHGRELYRRAG